MARITAGVGTSHVPAIGAAIDLGKTQEAYWAPLFAGYERSRAWEQDAKPDVVILDLILPKMSGFEVMETIAADPELSKIPVIVLSNLAQDADIEKLKKMGAREYFVKVRISTDDIIKRIKTLVA